MRRFALCGLVAGLALAATSTAAQDLASARTFVAGLYAAYHGDGPDYLGRQSKAVFSPRLLALIHLDQIRTPKGDVGALDGDPICDCQDAGGLKLADLKVTAGANGRAIAVARLRYPGETRTLRLDLVSVAGAWRVDDIHSADTPSLAAFLRRHAGGR